MSIVELEHVEAGCEAIKAALYSCVNIAGGEIQVDCYLTTRDMSL